MWSVFRLTTPTNATRQKLFLFLWKYVKYEVKRKLAKTAISGSNGNCGELFLFAELPTILNDRKKQEFP